MSQIKVDSIVPRGGLPSGASGGITQTVQAFKDDEFSFTTTGANSYVDLTGLSVTITPQSASNKILIIAHICSNQANASMNSLRCLRGSTAIGNGTETNLTQAITTSTMNSDRHNTMSFCILDSPNTTSATTYKVQMSKSQSGTMRINRRDTTSTSGFSASSSVTAFEVSA